MHLGLGALPQSSTVRRQYPCQAITCRSSTRVKLIVPNTMGSIVIKLPLPPVACPRYGMPNESVSGKLPLSIPSLLQHIRRRFVDEDATCSSWVLDDIMRSGRRAWRLDGRDGGGSFLASRRRGVSRGEIAVEDALKGEQACEPSVKEPRHEVSAANRTGDREAGPGQDRPGGCLQDRDYGQSPPKDAIRQDSWGCQ